MKKPITNGKDKKNKVEIKNGIVEFIEERVENTKKDSEESLDGDENNFDSGDDEIKEDDVDEIDDDDDDDDDNEDDNEDEIDDDDDDDDDEDDDFEDQGSSSDEDDLNSNEGSSSKYNIKGMESGGRNWVSTSGAERSNQYEIAKLSGELESQRFLHTDDLSSDDEDDDINTIGRVPLHWYDAYDHIGYDVAGSKVIKKIGKDRLDIAISNRDNEESRRTVYDMYNDREIVLSQREIEIIRRMQAGAFAHPEFNDTPDYIDYESSIKEIMPIGSAPEPKRRFISSKWEMMKIMKIVKAIKEGRYTTIQEIKQKKIAELNKSKNTYMIWKEDTADILEDNKRSNYHLPAPKMPLPGHAESYNPPPEYLLTEEEQKAMEEMNDADKPYNFIPQKYSSLRHVKGYDNFIKERFERCLDLYLCPRKLKKRLNIDPETLVPRLPRPSELRPYPNSLCLQFLGHEKAVRSLTISPDGQYIVSCSDDCTVRLWEVDTCLCRSIWTFDSIVSKVIWNPNASHHLLAIIVGSRVILIQTGTGDFDEAEITETLLLSALEIPISKNKSSTSTDEDEDSNSDEDSDTEEELSNKDEDDDEENKKKPKLTRKNNNMPQWNVYSPSTTNESNTSPLAATLWHGYVTGPRVQLDLGEEVTQIAWHYKGDYLCTLAPTAGANALSIHQLSKGESQYPFKKTPGRVQAISFHPSRPYLFVATQQHVKIFNLIEQKLVKRLLSGCKWISTIDIHPSGDHVLLGSYDRRLVWFDLDLSSSPFKTLKFHEKAIREVQFHKRYPLFASASDDGNVHVFHSTVYSDLSTNPLIVPLKVLHGHGVKGGLGVMSVLFHTRQPWLFTAGADGVINLFQDI